MIILSRVKIPCHNRSYLFFSTKKSIRKLKRFTEKLFNSITMFHNIRKCMFFVITKAFFHFHLEILFDTIPILLKWVS